MLKPPICVWLAAALAAVQLAGCEKHTPWLYPACANPDPLTQVNEPANPLYYPDVQEIVDGNCVGCHTAGGIAPFPLTTYDDVAAESGPMRTDVVAGIMPPFLPDPCCGQYLHNIRLNDTQIATIAAWIDHGMPEGDPANAVSVQPSPGMSRVDLSIQMPAPYTPTKLDELRCFVLPWPEATTKYVTGINVVPGNRSVVHHIILYVVDGNTTSSAKSMEGADGKPGFDCSGGLLGLQVTGSIGGWQPGSNGIDFPFGLGTKVPDGSAIVLDVHYSLAHGGSGSDLTSVQFKLDDSVSQELGGIAIGDLLWLLDGAMTVPANSLDTVYATELDASQLFEGKQSFDMYNASVHMHQYGTKALLTLIHPDGTSDCLLQISQWSFGWQGTWWFSGPQRVNRGDRLHFECHFANPTNHDFVWANEGEMCAAFAGTTLASP